MSTADPSSSRPNGAEELLPIPAVGRVFRTSRTVRGSEVDSGGRLRLDAIARMLQDVATDDGADLARSEAGSEMGPEMWVVRRTLIEQLRPAGPGETLELATFCSGLGSRWAERRISILGEDGAAIEAVALWVHLDRVSGRPKLLPSRYAGDLAASASGRMVSARQVIDPVRPDAPADAGPDAGPDAEAVSVRSWWPRATDVDILDHVNNAVAWAVLEQVFADRLAATGFRPGSAGDPRAGAFRAAVEFRDAIDRPVVESGEPMVVAATTRDRATALTLWSPDRATAHLSARFDPRD